MSLWPYIVTEDYQKRLEWKYYTNFGLSLYVIVTP